MKKELKIWAGIAPVLTALGVVEKVTATHFDQNEYVTIAGVGVFMRVGALVLGNKHMRALIREFLDSFEKHETDSLP